METLRVLFKDHSEIQVDSRLSGLISGSKLSDRFQLSIVEMDFFTHWKHDPYHYGFKIMFESFRDVSNPFIKYIPESLSSKIFSEYPIVIWNGSASLFDRIYQCHQYHQLQSLIRKYHRGYIFRSQLVIAYRINRKTTVVIEIISYDQLDGMIDCFKWSDSYGIEFGALIDLSKEQLVYKDLYV
jgi:hypothetical protein